MGTRPIRVGDIVQFQSYNSNEWEFFATIFNDRDITLFLNLVKRMDGNVRITRLEGSGTLVVCSAY